MPRGVAAVPFSLSPPASVTGTLARDVHALVLELDAQTRCGGSALARERGLDPLDAPLALRRRQQQRRWQAAP